MSEARVTIYTDGACSGNPGPGGWGVLLIYGAARRTLQGGESETTNNRMELMAAIMALETSIYGPTRNMSARALPNGWPDGSAMAGKRQPKSRLKMTISGSALMRRRRATVWNGIG